MAGLLASIVAALPTVAAQVSDEQNEAIAQALRQICDANPGAVMCPEACINQTYQVAYIGDNRCECSITPDIPGNAQGAADDSCQQHANDGFCDEPNWCESGTDCTDCGTCVQSVGPVCGDGGSCPTTSNSCPRAQHVVQGGYLFQDHYSLGHEACIGFTEEPCSSKALPPDTLLERDMRLHGPAGQACPDWTPLCCYSEEREYCNPWSDTIRRRDLHPNDGACSAAACRIRDTRPTEQIDEDPTTNGDEAFQLSGWCEKQSMSQYGACRCWDETAKPCGQTSMWKGVDCKLGVGREEFRWSL